jgi:hypothetical protein
MWFPQVSSKKATIAGPIGVGSCVGTTNTLRRKIGIHTNRHLLPQGIYYAGILKLAALAAREKVSGEHSKPRQEAAVHYTPVF